MFSSGLLHAYWRNATLFVIPNDKGNPSPLTLWLEVAKKRVCWRLLLHLPVTKGFLNCVSAKLKQQHGLERRNFTETAWDPNCRDQAHSEKPLVMYPRSICKFHSCLRLRPKEFNLDWRTWLNRSNTSEERGHHRWWIWGLPAFYQATSVPQDDNLSLLLPSVWQDAWAQEYDESVPAGRRLRRSWMQSVGSIF